MIIKASLACAAVLLAFVAYAVGFRCGWKSLDRIRRGRSIAED